MTADAMIRTADFTTTQGTDEPTTTQGTDEPTRCAHCGPAGAPAPRVLSRHRTSTGETVWTRCACGSLQVRTRDAAGEHVVAFTAPRSP